MQTDTNRRSETGTAGGHEVEGFFKRRRPLRKAVTALMANGVPTNTIHVFLVDGEGRRTREVPVESGSGTLKGALLGASIGGLLGLLLVVLTVSGVFGTPAENPYAVRSLTGAIYAIAMGAAAGVPIGAVVGLGHWQGLRRIPNTDLEQYQAAVVVDSEAKADVARRILHEKGATNVTG